MKFRSDKAIFQQIVDHIEDQVILGTLPAEARIPAVRDYAMEMQVNPNTVVRSYLELEQAGVIFKKRGLGYFVSADARERILKRRKKKFLEYEAPDVARKMRLLGIGMDELKKIYDSQET